MLSHLHMAEFVVVRSTPRHGGRYESTIILTQQHVRPSPSVDVT